MAESDIPIGLIRRSFPKPISTVTRQTDNTAFLLSFVNRLESYKTKFKNLHWSAMNVSVHVYVGDFLDELDEYQDELAEATQGIIGQFGPNDVLTVHLTQEDPLLAIKDLKKEVLNFHSEIESNPDYIGLVNSTEGFLTIIDKFTYLIDLAKKC